MASGLAGKPSAFVSSDVAFDSEPIVGSFTVDGLTFAVIDESRVELVGVAPSVALSGGSEAGVVEGPDEGHASLILPESVTYEGATYALASIGAFAFYLSGVTDVTLPASVADVDDRAFRSSDVARADVDQANPALSSYDGALYSADTTRILLVPEGRSGQLRIPSRAASLLPEAFSHCASLEGFAVDAGCPAFSSGDGILYDGSGETLLRVAPGAAEATIREGCTTIAAGALEACAKLTTINAPASVTSISPDIFHAVPTVSLPAASAILSEGNEAAGAEGSEAEGFNEGPTSAASTQLSAMVALSSTDDGLFAINPSTVVVRLPENADQHIWSLLGLKILLEDMSIAAAATYAASSSFINGGGGALSVFRQVGLDATSMTAIANGLSQWTASWTHATSIFADTPVVHYWQDDYFFEVKVSRAHYSFAGWNVNGTKLPNTTPLVAGATVTALWTPSAYSISCNYGGGSVSTPNKTSYHIETSTFNLINPTRQGYTFIGWSGTGLSGSANKTVTISQGSTGNRSYVAHWAPALSADMPLEVEARVDVLGIEEQAPATGYIESRCGEPLKVAEVSMEPLLGATELFGAGNEQQVQLQALAGQGAVWQPGGANASFAFPLGPLGYSATEADPSKLAPLYMAKYGDRVPVSYRFSIPEALLATLTETTKPVCSVSYTVMLV